MTFSADCNSPNTAVAAMIKVPIPTAVATIPDRVLLALLNMSLHGSGAFRTDEVGELAE